MRIFFPYHHLLLLASLIYQKCKIDRIPEITLGKRFPSINRHWEKWITLLYLTFYHHRNSQHKLFEKICHQYFYSNIEIPCPVLLLYLSADRSSVSHSSIVITPIFSLVSSWLDNVIHCFCPLWNPLSPLTTPNLFFVVLVFWFFTYLLRFKFLLNLWGIYEKGDEEKF